jgi:transcriptional regulator with XRE-family HTH domain
LLIEARKAAGVRQADIAAAMQRPQSFVSKYEKRERTLDIAEFILICRLISVDPYKILKRAEIDLNLTNFTKPDVK